MTSIAPNRSLVEGRVVARSGDELTVEVIASRPAWPKVRDLAAEQVGGRLTVIIPAETDGLAAGELVVIECSLEPRPGGGVAFVAARLERG